MYNLLHRPLFAAVFLPIVHNAGDQSVCMLCLHSPFDCVDLSSCVRMLSGGWRDREGRYLAELKSALNNNNKNDNWYPIVLNRCVPSWPLTCISRCGIFC